jgi:hypothetical protein
MIVRAVGVLVAFFVCTNVAIAQTTVQSYAPTLAELLQNIYGPHGLVVDSEAVLPDGSTHSAHFNGAFQAEFEQINLAFVRQIGALPIPSPASGFTYTFDTSSGTFRRTTQSFGPILADRAETIGRGRFAFGYSLQQFSFQTFDGLRLSHIPGVFTHDDFQLGGGRADFITTQNAISASVSQQVVWLTYGAASRLDVSAAVPLVHTSLSIVSDATIHRVGTTDNPAIHFFRDSDAPGGYGDERRFIADGSATGVGDIVVRAKETAIKTTGGGLAIGLEARLPSGDAQNLLGSGSFGIKPFLSTSMMLGHVAPHVNVAYQWNTDTILAGDVAANTKGNLPDELSYAVGADVGVERRFSLAFDVLGRRSPDTPRLVSSTFVSQGTPSVPSETVPDIAFTNGTLNVVNGSVGMKLNVASTLLVTANVMFPLNDSGVRTRITPLIGFEFGF